MYPLYDNLQQIVSNFLKSNASIPYRKLQPNDTVTADVSTAFAASVVADDCDYDSEEDDGDFVVVSPEAAVKI